VNKRGPLTALRTWWRNLLGGAARPVPELAPNTHLDGDRFVDAAFLRRLDRLALQANRRLRGDNIGARPSFRRLPANDFREHRQYLPGDDLRHVDWNASARSQHVFVKLGERPKEASIHILLDSTASMQWGEPSKVWAARRLAAALGYIALNHGDRLALADTAGQAAPFGPKMGKGQVPALLRFLRELPFPKQADLGAATLRLARTHRRGGLAILITDLTDVEDLAPVLAPLRPPTWQVLVLHLLHPAELEPTLRGEIELHDAETGERANYDLSPEALARYRAFAAEWCTRVEQACLAHGAAYGRVLADWPIEQAVLPYLRRRQVVDQVQA
jgi:uncharacterized protein (DUF58 family)